MQIIFTILQLFMLFYRIPNFSSFKLAAKLTQENLSTKLRPFLVVSTVASGILFAHFSTVECISNKSGFLFMTS